jgi:16S rRNA (adenine1518-N6/adenine1519-N6)-dimethyltransferase
MIEPSVYERMIDYASLTRNDTVLDVGAGLGFLTSLMANKCKTVLAVEADTQLATILSEQLAGTPNVKIVQDDILKADIPPFNKIVSTPPYSISSRLLLWILQRNFDCAVLVFQKEFANRLAASVGNQDYGWLSVLTYYYAEVEVLDDVPKWMFYPPPKVDSVITRLTPKKSQLNRLKSEAAFKRFVQTLFTERNKKARSAILQYMKTSQGLSKPDALKIVGYLPFLEKRVRELAPEDFGVLADALL